MTTVPGYTSQVGVAVPRAPGVSSSAQASFVGADAAASVAGTLADTQAAVAKERQALNGMAANEALAGARRAVATTLYGQRDPTTRKWTGGVMDLEGPAFLEAAPGIEDRLAEAEKALDVLSPQQRAMAAPIWQAIADETRMSVGRRELTMRRGAAVQQMRSYVAEGVEFGARHAADQGAVALDFADHKNPLTSAYAGLVQRLQTHAAQFPETLPEAPDEWVRNEAKAGLSALLRETIDDYLLRDERGAAIDLYDNVRDHLQEADQEATAAKIAESRSLQESADLRVSVWGEGGPLFDVSRTATDPIQTQRQAMLDDFEAAIPASWGIERRKAEMARAQIEIDESLAIQAIEREEMVSDAQRGLAETLANDPTYRIEEHRDTYGDLNDSEFSTLYAYQEKVRNGVTEDVARSTSQELQAIFLKAEGGDQQAREYVANLKLWSVPLLQSGDENNTLAVAHFQKRQDDIVKGNRSLLTLPPEILDQISLLVDAETTDTKKRAALEAAIIDGATGIFSERQVVAGRQLAGTEAYRALDDALGVSLQSPFEADAVDGQRISKEYLGGKALYEAAAEDVNLEAFGAERVEALRYSLAASGMASSDAHLRDYLFTALVRDDIIEREVTDALPGFRAAIEDAERQSRVATFEEIAVQRSPDLPPEQAVEAARERIVETAAKGILEEIRDDGILLDLQRGFRVGRDWRVIPDPTRQERADQAEVVRRVLRRQAGEVTSEAELREWWDTEGETAFEREYATLRAERRVEAYDARRMELRGADSVRGVTEKAAQAAAKAAISETMGEAYDRVTWTSPGRVDRRRKMAAQIMVEAAPYGLTKAELVAWWREHGEELLAMRPPGYGER